MFVAIDPYVRVFPGLKRVDAGYVCMDLGSGFKCMQGDWGKQRGTSLPAPNSLVASCHT